MYYIVLYRDCFSRHFQEQVKLYGQQVIINLVDQKVIFDNILFSILIMYLFRGQREGLSRN